MIDLYDNESNALIGSVTEAELQLLIDTLEEESWVDQTISSTRPPSICSATAGPPTTCCTCCERRWARARAWRSAGNGGEEGRCHLCLATCDL